MSDPDATRKHTILVSIDTGMPNTLKVSIPELGIDPEDGTQQIEWVLDDALSRGGAEFLQPTACPAGFEWLSAPPPASAVFGPAARVKKDEIKIADTHKKDSDSRGTWLYKLRVAYQGQVYATPMAIDTLASGETRAYVLVGSNPIIINR